MCNHPDECFVCGEDTSAWTFQARSNHVVWHDSGVIRHRHNFDGFTAPRETSLPDLLMRSMDNPDNEQLRQDCQREIYSLLGEISSQAKGAASLRALEQIASMVGLIFKEKERQPDQWLVLKLSEKATAGMDEEARILDELWEAEE